MDKMNDKGQMELDLGPDIEFIEIKHDQIKKIAAEFYELLQELGVPKKLSQHILNQCAEKAFFIGMDRCGAIRPLDEEADDVARTATHNYLYDKYLNIEPEIY